MSSDSTLKRFAGWYVRHCDGDWEHEHGFHITTLDNPGVEIDIDLRETELQQVPFAEVKDDYESEDNWLICTRTDERFEARGAATRFEDMLRIFLDWADAHRTI